jgi:hypothetical protein
MGVQGGCVFSYVLNSTLNEAMGSLPAGYTLQEVIMGEGTMTVNGRKQ